jgi:glycosyltransferase involved in cell wall biosynthesis
MEQINSKEYWDRRFEDDWTKYNGDSQSKYFARLACELIPTWLIEEININKYEVCDLGCAEGDSLPILKDLFVNSRINGEDFSEKAIEKAREKYNNFDFRVSNILEPDEEKKYSVVFSSNTVEHFKDTMEVLKKIFMRSSLYTIIMVPFREDKYISDEHEVIINTDSVPLEIEGNKLVFGKSIQCNSEYYVCEQLLLVYSKKEEDIHYLSDIVENVVSNGLKLERFKYEELVARYNSEIQKYEESLTRANEERVLLDVELQNLKSKNEELENKYFALDDSVNEYKDKYENLYQYSCCRDGELLSIKNSRSYTVFRKYFVKPMKFTYKIVSKVYRIFKYLFKLQFKLLLLELASPFIRVKNKLTQIILKNKILKQLNKDVQGKRVLILPPTLDWHMPLFQRPQQLAQSYSQKDNMVVIYITKNIQYDRVAVADKVSDTLWIVNEILLDNLDLEGSKEKILSLSWTPNKFYCDKIKPEKLIYEYIDELEIFHMYGPEMEKDHQELLQKADTTVCTATKLFEQVKGKAKNPIISTNAGDYDFFAKTEQFEINDLIKDKIKNYDCILGYYGAVAKWYDYELVKKVANMKKNWLWVIVGINYDGTLDKSGILDIENVLYIPPQPYKLLPSFLKAFDIATIPFIINEITLSTSPVKLFEYMASGKPIIASKMPECLKYESVKTYSDADEFVKYAEELLKLKADDKYWKILDQDARNNTWDAKTDEILESIYEERVLKEVLL